MTRYEQGFLTKCAEYGVPEGMAVDLLEKVANSANLIRSLRRYPWMMGLAQEAAPVIREGLQGFGANQVARNPATKLTNLYQGFKRQSVLNAAKQRAAAGTPRPEALRGEW